MGLSSVLTRRAPPVVGLAVVGATTLYALSGDSSGLLKRAANSTATVLAEPWSDKSHVPERRTHGSGLVISEIDDETSKVVGTKLVRTLSKSVAKLAEPWSDQSHVPERRTHGSGLVISEIDEETSNVVGTKLVRTLSKVPIKLAEPWSDQSHVPERRAHGSGVVFETSK